MAHRKFVMYRQSEICREIIDVDINPHGHITRVISSEEQIFFKVCLFYRQVGREKPM